MIGEANLQSLTKASFFHDSFLLVWCLHRYGEAAGLDTGFCHQLRRSMEHQGRISLTAPPHYSGACGCHGVGARIAQLVKSVDPRSRDRGFESHYRAFFRHGPLANPLLKMEVPPISRCLAFFLFRHSAILFNGPPKPEACWSDRS